MFELNLAGAFHQCQMNKKNMDAVEFDFDDEAFESDGKVMERIRCQSLLCEQGVCLPAEDRNPPGERIQPVFHAAVVILIQRHGDPVRLIDIIRPEGARIDFDQPDDIRFCSGDEPDDVVQRLFRCPEVTVCRQNVFPHAAGRAGAVSDIVNEKSHDSVFFPVSVNIYAKSELPKRNSVLNYHGTVKFYK